MQVRLTHRRDYLDEVAEVGEQLCVRASTRIEQLDALEYPCYNFTVTVVAAINVCNRFLFSFNVLDLNTSLVQMNCNHFEHSARSGWTIDWLASWLICRIIVGFELGPILDLRSGIRIISTFVQPWLFWSQGIVIKDGDCRLGRLPWAQVGAPRIMIRPRTFCTLTTFIVSGIISEISPAMPFFSIFNKFCFLCFFSKNLTFSFFLFFQISL